MPRLSRSASFATPVRLLSAGLLLLLCAAPVVAADSCQAALRLLRQNHGEAVASGKGSARQIEQSATYLRRLEAWWKMEAGNPMLQASCAAIAAGGLSSDEDEDDEGMSDEEFSMLMRQFDKAGVPR